MPLRPREVRPDFGGIVNISATLLFILGVLLLAATGGSRAGAVEGSLA
jgi:hypothetical protein